MKAYYAIGNFGLPCEQIRYWNELVERHKRDVFWKWGKVNPENYVYAVKKDGSLVNNRFKRDFHREKVLSE
jgi:hypothetical protein